MTIERFPTWGRLDEYDNFKAALLGCLADRPFLPDFYMLEKDEQRIAQAVCHATGMSLDRWDRLSLPERVPWLATTIKSLNKPKSNIESSRANAKHESKVETNSSQQPDKSSAMSLDAKAVAVFVDHPDWTKVQIAKHIGTNSRCLAPKRCPQLDKAIAGYKAMNKTIPHGSKDANGNVEAYDK